MSEQERIAGQAGPTKPPGTRKPYEAPAWEVEKAEIEAAMACVKADDNACPGGPIQS